MKSILILALCCALSSTPALAASAPRWATLPQQPDKLLFSGTVVDDLAPEYARVFSLPANMLEEELARIRLSVLSSGKHDQAIQETYAIWVRLARTPHRDGSGPLARAIAMRAWVLAESGQPDQARIALHTPLPPIAEFYDFYNVGSYSSSELDPDSAFQRKLADLIAANPAVIEMRNQLEGESSEENTFVKSCRERMGEENYRYLEENFGLPTDDVAEQAMQGLKGNNGQFLKKLGSQAVAAVAAVALADPNGGGYPGVPMSCSAGSVRTLLHLDRARALRLFTDRFEARDAPRWHSRILEACNGQKELENRASWVPFPPPMAEVERTGGRPWTPEWSPLLAKLLSDETTREETVALVRPFAFWDGFTPELQRALGACLCSDDQALAVKVLAAVDDLGRVRSAFPVYVAGLESPFPDIRRASAWRLSAFKAVEALSPFVRDPDPEVRRAVAEAFRQGKVRVRYGNLNHYESHEIVIFLAEHIPVFEALLVDGEASVREVANAVVEKFYPARALYPELVGSSEPRIRALAVSRLSDFEKLSSAELELLRRLLRDPDPLVRSHLADRCIFEDSSVRTEILTTLTGDTAPEVLETLDESLSGQGKRRRWSREWQLAAIPLRLANPTAPFEPYGGGEDGWLSFAENNQVKFSVAPFLLALALERGYDPLVAHQLDTLIVTLDPPPAQAGSMIGSWPIAPVLDVNRYPDAMLLLELDPATRRALYTWGDAQHELGDRQARKLRQGLIGRVMNWDDEAAVSAVEAGDFDHRWVRSILSKPLRTDAKAQELRWGIFRDETAPLSLRLAAGAGTDVLARAEGEPILDELLAKAVGEDELHALSRVLRGSRRGNEYLLQVMNENRLAPEPLLYFVEASFDRRVPGPGADRVALVILDRYLEAPGEENGAVRHALAVLERGMLVYEHPGYLLTASRDPRYVDDAISTMATRHLPEFVEPLCGMFRNDWPALTTENVEEVRMNAADALSEYGGREAMEFLSSIVFEVEGGVRESVVEALENLRRYEELRASWRTSPLPPREEALIDLVEMLDSQKPTVRAAAARGIATFGAIEAIPKLIGLLEDDSEVVRAAAEQALEQLFENPPESAGSEEESSGEGDEK